MVISSFLMVIHPPATWVHVSYADDLDLDDRIHVNRRAAQIHILLDDGHR